MERQFEVLLHNREYLDSHLAALAKRAVKKGLTPMTWAWGKAYEKTRVDEVTGVRTVIARIPLVLSGEVPKYAGWSFVAALEHLGEENIVRGLKAVPKEYRNAAPDCGHCKHKRKRSNTYVLEHEDSRVIQVGSTCIEDFLGTDSAGKLAAAASYVADVMSACEDAEEGSYGGGRTPDYILGAYLVAVAWCVRTEGWVSKAAANDGARSSTASLADRILSDAKVAETWKYEPSDADLAMADAAEAWAEALSDTEVDAAKGDYLHNLRVIARHGVVGPRAMGFAASMVVAYQKAMGIERLSKKNAARPSEHVGTVGKRQTWAVTLEFVTGYETSFGYTTINKFRTDDGDMLVWKASSGGLGRGEVGKRFSLKGTVKKHDLYKGEAQTLVSRCVPTELETEGKAPCYAQHEHPSDAQR